MYFLSVSGAHHEPRLRADSNSRQGKKGCSYLAKNQTGIIQQNADDFKGI